MSNLVPGRDRAVSVARVDVPLTDNALARHFLGREVYRRTRFVVVRGGDDVALVEVDRADPAPLFSPIVAVRVLARPDECAIVADPEVDTTVPTQLARAAREHAPGRRCLVVQGRYEHVSFVLDPRPVRVRVVEVVPPEPPKLISQVERILDLAEDLPPVEVVPELIRFADLAATSPAPRVLVPCRGGGVRLDGAALDYLDERPPRDDWVLVGCARSRELHRWFYGDLPESVELCPVRVAPTSTLPTLRRCCQLEDRVEVGEGGVTVPWGASLAEVREALTSLVRAVEPAWTPA